MPSPLKKTVLLTGAGGAAVPGLVRRLQTLGYRVLAGDMDLNAPGLYTADQGFIIPAGGSPEFLPAVRKICQNENVDAFIPLVDEELLSSFELAQEGIVVLLPQREFTRICLDKFVLTEKLHALGIRAPRTRLASAMFHGLDFPVVVKPRQGRGSRGLGIIHTPEDLERFIAHSSYSPEELLIQDCIEGVEFTVSVVVWRDGSVQAVVPKEIVSKKGITRLAVTRFHPEIEEVCKTIQEKMRADGPFNVQLILDSHNVPFIFEINPRFSTSISLTLAAGVDELGVLLEQALFSKSPSPLSWKEGVVLMRQTEDRFLSAGEFFQKRGVIQGKIL